jgi:hypothetical protein
VHPKLHNLIVQLYMGFVGLVLFLEILDLLAGVLRPKKQYTV